MFANVKAVCRTTTTALASLWLLAGSHECLAIEDPVAFGAARTFVPQGFDSNDEVEVIVDGFLPSTCYKLAEPRVRIDLAERHVHITPVAYVMPAPCMLMRVPFTATAHVGRLPAGQYTVTTQGVASASALPVKAATSVRQDDFVYAPVDRVSLTGYEPGSPTTATLEGRFTLSCMEWDHVDVNVYDHIVEILPALRANRDIDCIDTIRPFVKAVDLPLAAENGRYLIYVRVMSGKALSTVFDHY